MDYKATLNLPKTPFPMKANLARMEPDSLASWEAMGFYKRLRETGAGRPLWILHDGPPYANAPIHMGNNHTLGERGGEQAHTLSISELPLHTHVLQASTTDGDGPVPTAHVLAASAVQFYGAAGNLTSLLPASIANVGGSQAHLNMQPFLVLSFCIALQGIFPSQN